MRIFRLLLINTFAFLTTTTLSGQNRALDLMLADTSLAGTSYSICFMDVITGEIILDFDSRRNLCPASVMKLFPTAAALTLLGEDYRFRTEVRMRGVYDRRRGVLNGDIVIVGGGDPALGSEYFKDHYGDITVRWAAALYDSVGLRRVTGRVAAATSCYDYHPVPPGWVWEDLGNYYGAGVHDINYNDNIFSIYISGHDEGSRATIDSSDNCGKDISLENYLFSSGTRDKGYVFNAPYSYAAWLYGSVPVNKQTVLKASLPDPPFTLCNDLTRELQKNSVRTDGLPSHERVVFTPADSGAKIITTISPTLAEIVNITNHESVNLFAEQLCKHLGLKVSGEGSFSAGVKVIKAFLSSAGCDASHSMILDASGVSPNNNISAFLTASLLRHMYLGNKRDIFFSSLPEASVTGTMKNYFRDPVFQGRVVAKTGSMTGVRSFGGYVTTSSGKVLAFTMIANGFTAPWRNVTNNMEGVVKEIILAN